MRVCAFACVRVRIHSIFHVQAADIAFFDAQMKELTSKSDDEMFSLQETCGSLCQLYHLHYTSKTCAKGNLRWQHEGMEFGHHITNTCQGLVKHLSSTCQALVKHLSSTCQALVKELSRRCVGEFERRTCQALVKHLSSTCQALVEHPSRSCRDGALVVRMSTHRAII